MATTLDKYRGAKARNYCSLPTRDVEILEPDHKCECGTKLTWDKDAGYFGRWEHAGDAGECTYATPRPTCTYCGATGEEVTFHQQAWSDETHCARCGGINGYGIGD